MQFLDNAKSVEDVYSQHFITAWYRLILLVDKFHQLEQNMFTSIV